jgi:DNA-binding GntR family transcriptional regulator
MIDTTDSEDGPQGNGAYRRLLEEISRGDLLPGARLRETELAERLSISRTPVREAIRQLEADGLVAHVPRQGATIRVLDYTEVMELYEMRAVLEGTAARLAARAASDLELDELAALNEELAATEDLRLAYDLNRQFHLTLLDAAKNRYLVKSVNALQKTLLILGSSTLVEAERASQAVKEHADVLDALKDRDGARAEALMRAHIEAAHRVRLKTLRNRERPIDAG